MNHGKEVIIAALLSVCGLALYVAVRVWLNTHASGPVAPIAHIIPVPVEQATSTTSRVPNALPSFPTAVTQISYGLAPVVASSSAVFNYAHGTLVADERLFIGSEDSQTADGHLAVFYDPAHLGAYSLISVPRRGSIETMAYDDTRRTVDFLISESHGLHIYSIDPYTLIERSIASTSAIDAGDKPAIVTDGAYVYGITNTTPAEVFKVSLRDGRLSYNANGHIPHGHSAALMTEGSSTFLYFGSNTSDVIEKVDAATLSVSAAVDLGTCHPSDDMPAFGGYVYVGCEGAPYGFRINGVDMSVTRFTLPGDSLGLFVYGSDLYNCGMDGYLDVFPGMNLGSLRRYKVTGIRESSTTSALPPELNEILYEPVSHKLFLTIWWGVPGLYEVSTSTGIMP
ncbi:MAG: hypothetical protein KGI59_00125 [Patescibacteria group bacterium]|nr:hypothetical protein [Patescibacteria group bacterium]